jgi:hypothetical protein
LFPTRSTQFAQLAFLDVVKEFDTTYYCVGLAGNINLYKLSNLASVLAISSVVILFKLKDEPSLVMQQLSSHHFKIPRPNKTPRNVSSTVVMMKVVVMDRRYLIEVKLY